MERAILQERGQTMVWGLRQGNGVMRSDILWWTEVTLFLAIRQYIL